LLVAIFVIASSCQMSKAVSRSDGPGMSPAWAGDAYINSEYLQVDGGGGGGGDGGYIGMSPAATPNYSRPLDTPMSGGSIGRSPSSPNPYSMSNDALFLDGTTSTRL